MSANLQQLDVFQHLSQSRAKLLRSHKLSNGLGMAVWANQDDRTQYQAPHHHTLSIYLRGGYDTARIEGRQRKTGGAPGRICIMPADHQSSWEVPGDLSFMHLYFDQAQLNQISEHSFDRSIAAQLPDLTFSEDAWLSTLCQQSLLPLDWNANSDQLLLSSLTDSMLHYLVARYLGKHNPPPVLTGGLAPFAQKHLMDYIEANLDQPLRIETLAQLVGLSSYHFARMFKQSFACSPHQYVTERRLQRALADIRAQQPLQSIALQYGFSDQSHFSKAFKKRFGVTPLQLRQQSGLSDILVDH